MCHRIDKSNMIRFGNLPSSSTHFRCRMRKLLAAGWRKAAPGNNRAAPGNNMGVDFADRKPTSRQ
jgi:hypothetical protein